MTEPIIAYLCSRNPLMGGEYYRATRPAALVNRRFDWATAVCDRMATEEDDGPLSFLTPDGKVVITPNIIIVRPIREWRQRWTDQAHANGQLVVADIDDDVWSHENYDALQDSEPDFYNEWFFNTDAVLVSTPYLKRRVLELGHPGPVAVAPNCYDPFGLAMEAHPGRLLGTRLWISGRMEGDLELYDKLIYPLLEQLDLTFLHVGAESGHRFEDRGWDNSRVKEVGSLPIPLFPQAFADLSIGVICMADHAFNLAKTETHAVELGSMGVPLVAVSNHRLYKHVPGRVDATADAVRERVVALLEPNYWRFESARVKHWAREVAARNESFHLDALHSLVDVILSRQRISLV